MVRKASKLKWPLSLKLTGFANYGRTRLQEGRWSRLVLEWNQGKSKVGRPAQRMRVS